MAKGTPKARKPDPRKVEKRPVAKRLPQREGLDRRPLFSFEHADRGSGHGFHFRVDVHEESHAVLSFLHSIGGTSWAELRNHRYNNSKGSRPKHHEHPISRLGPEATARLANLKLDEVVGEDLFRFRLTGKQRLWGFITDGTFHVLWWDPEHEVFPVSKD
jgi:hypothetical protein